jgi:hypothetical protein
MDEVNAKIAAHSLDSTGQISQLNSLMQEYILEALALMFLGMRLGVLRGGGSPIGQRLFAACQAHFASFYQTTLMPRRWARLSPHYWRLVAAWRTIMEVCRDRADVAAAAVMASCGETTAAAELERRTVLGLLTRRCGPGSDMPAVVAADAFIAGVGTEENLFCANKICNFHQCEGAAAQPQRSAPLFGRAVGIKAMRLRLQTFPTKIYTLLPPPLC